MSTTLQFEVVLLYISRVVEITALNDLDCDQTRVIRDNYLRLWWVRHKSNSEVVVVIRHIHFYIIQILF